MGGETKAAATGERAAPKHPHRLHSPPWPPARSKRLVEPTPRSLRLGECDNLLCTNDLCIAAKRVSGYSVWVFGLGQGFPDPIL